MPALMPSPGRKRPIVCRDGVTGFELHLMVLTIQESPIDRFYEVFRFAWGYPEAYCGHPQVQIVGRNFREYRDCELGGGRKPYNRFPITSMYGQSKPQALGHSLAE